VPRFADQGGGEQVSNGNTTTGEEGAVNRNPEVSPNHLEPNPLGTQVSFLCLFSVFTPLGYGNMGVVHIQINLAI
jgi:hypothetical protein